MTNILAGPLIIAAAVLGLGPQPAMATSMRMAQASAATIQGCIDDSASPPLRIASCSKLIAEVPETQREKAFVARGNAYLDGGDLDHALADYDKAIELQPDDREARYARGYARHDKGNFDGAIADYSEAIRSGGDDGDVFYSRGLSYQAKSDLDHAIADYTTVIRLKPDHANAFHNRAIAYKKKGDLANALKDAAMYQKLTGKDD